VSNVLDEGGGGESGRVVNPGRQPKPSTLLG
jgi:hypothetical protein